MIRKVLIKQNNQATKQPTKITPVYFLATEEVYLSVFLLKIFTSDHYLGGFLSLFANHY